MWVKFKNTGRIIDTKAAETFIRLGVAEAVEPVKEIEPKKADVLSEIESTPKLKVKHKPIKRRGRPSKKKK